MNRKAYLAIPSLTGQLKQATEATVMCIKMEAESMGFGLQEFRLVGDSIITHARNTILAHFLKSDATELFCLDADVAFGPGVFTRLMSHRVHFVAAVYRAKQDDERYPVRWPNPTDITVDNRTGLVEANDVPFGCVRISRQAIERMVAASPEDWFDCCYEPGLKCPLLFNTEFKDHQIIGEDFYFCRKWRETGGKVWVDMDIPIHHVGTERLQDGTVRDKVYSGCLGTFLQGRLG
jgi:hypothetical protein